MDNRKIEAVNAETFTANSDGRRHYGGSLEGTGTTKKSSKSTFKSSNPPSGIEYGIFWINIYGTKGHVETSHGV
jgi:hypothetical protein